MRALLLILLLLAGCANPYMVRGVDQKPLAQCYHDAFDGFCLINTDHGQVVVGTVQGVLQGIGNVVGTLNNTAVSSAAISAIP